MSKIREVEQAIRELRDAASLLNDTANWLYELFSADKVQEHNTDSAETQKQLTLEEVRAVCAEKSRAGFTAEVKSIITKHGADKLSAIKPEEYAAVLAEVENSIYRLSVAIKKTQRRANALQNIIIPRNERIVKFITDSLEEKDREEFSRMKVIKAAKLKSAK